VTISCNLFFVLALFVLLNFLLSREIIYINTWITRILILIIPEWVERMQQDLVKLAETASGVNNLAKQYIVEPNNARQLVASAARNIEMLLHKRSMALKELATAAENLQKMHQWKNDFGLDSNETEDRKDRIRPEFKEDPTFKRLISYNHTAVHIPTDIYEGSTIVLNELNWTEQLEEVFKKNREEDPTLLWQVFGSATGLARYFPASPWIDSRKTSKIDLYDVRRRPWYIQGAASPKDMLILVDASGSVSGLTLKLIRTSVSEMLETLSDDDYVNVAYFNAEANSITCFDHLVQANVRNKKILKDAVQNITAKGITSYKLGFEYAFKQFLNPNVTSANCNKIIMLFTDGGEERAQEIFEKYNQDKKVRVFTFSVGQHNYDKGPIQWMACTNKGYYYEIPSIGAIRINTQEYLDVLGRPMVLADEKAKQVQWTNVYLDALELGLVITGTLPVFNKTETKNQLILGVMAIDVSLEDIKRLTPRFTLGPNGYYFAIDPNGYVLLHPNLQPKVRGFISLFNLFLRVQPSLSLPQIAKFQEPVTLDFLDAELENEIKVEVGELWGYQCFYLLYIDHCSRTYTWSPVNTSYLGNDIGEMVTAIHSAFREYCKDLKILDNNTEFLMDFNEFIDKQTPNGPSCDCTSRNSACALSQCRQGVLARFVATDGGITRVYPKSAGETWTENPETYESSFYKRSLDNDIYIFTAPFYNESGAAAIEFGILISRSVDLNIDGVKLKPVYLIWNDQHTGPQLLLTVQISLTLQHIDCVILDDGGFLLMSNQDDYISQIGRFFGEVDPILMKTLVNTSLYSFHKTYDYQSVCKRERETKAAAGLRSVYVPTIADILQVGWWATAADDFSEFHSKESCITEQTQYYFEGSERSYAGVLDCGNCSRMYHAEKLQSTNLVFLIMDSKKTCPCEQNQKPLIQAEQQSTGPDPCKLAENPRYRKGPEVCFDNDENVSYRHCRKVGPLNPFNIHLFILHLSTCDLCYSHVRVTFAMP
uniref:Calcium voltage-gated channel auxiliary subunit alpha2delta 1 n=1 Tax=Scleropages formosus TaxID=113540 RepID=A0A8C9TY32_SCLFO